MRAPTQRPALWTRERFALCLLTCAGALAAGCAGPMSAARRMFSEEYFCPKDRVTVTPHVERGTGSGADVPPPDIANDPARLELWKKKQERDAADARSGKRLVDAEGCGKRHTYWCADDDEVGWTCGMAPPPPLPRASLLGDRDNDGVPDLEDACPDAPGVRDPDPTKNGCPKPSTPGTTSFPLAIPGVGGAELGQLQQLLQISQQLHHPKLGVALQDRPGHGVGVVGVMAGGRADGKLRAGDLIVEAEGTPVRGVLDLLRVMAAHQHDPLQLRVQRGGESVSVTLDPPPP